MFPASKSAHEAGPADERHMVFPERSKDEYTDAILKSKDEYTDTILKSKVEYTNIILEMNAFGYLL